MITQSAHLHLSPIVNHHSRLPLLTFDVVAPALLAPRLPWSRPADQVTMVQSATELMGWL